MISFSLKKGGHGTAFSKLRVGWAVGKRATSKEQTDKHVREGGLRGKQAYCQTLVGYFWLMKALKVKLGLEECAYLSRAQWIEGKLFTSLSSSSFSVALCNFSPLRLFI